MPKEMDSTTKLRKEFGSRTKTDSGTVASEDNNIHKNDNTPPAVIYVSASNIGFIQATLEEKSSRCRTIKTTS